MQKLICGLALALLTGCGATPRPAAMPVPASGAAAKFFDTTTATIKPNLYNGKKFKGLMLTVQPFMGGGITFDMVHLAIAGNENNMCVCSVFLGQNGSLYVERTVSGTWQDTAIAFSKIGTYQAARLDTGAPVTLQLAQGITLKKVTHPAADGGSIPEIVLDVTHLPPAESQEPNLIPALDPGA